MLQNRWKIILIATFFNLLFEYSLRGINNLQSQPFLPFILFAVYFTLFIIVEDLILRFKLKDYHLMVLAFFYGTIYCAFTSGIAFINPTFLGIAWVPLIAINIVWWGVVQALITFYFANLINPRDWNHPKLSRKGWIICVIINFLAIMVFQKSGLIPTGTPIGKLMIFVILLISVLVFVITLRQRNLSSNTFKKSNFLNIVCFVTISLFLFSAIFLINEPILANTSNVNSISLKIISWYTLGLSIVLFGYRIVMKKEIPV